MPDNKKVNFNLKNVHYAIWQSGTTYSAPVAVPGAVNLTLDPQGEMTPFYADGITYFQSVNNNGYSGSLEMANIPDVMLKDVWGFTEGATSKVITENAEAVPKVFALLFQVDNDAGNDYYLLYSCTGTRPNIGAATNTDTLTIQTQTINITAVPLSAGLVSARTTANTPAATKTGWFTSVFVEGAVPPEPEPEET